MSLELKGVDVAGDFLGDHRPENINFFSIWVTVTVGPKNEVGGSLYNFHVCSPDWLKYAVECETDNGYLWGLHTLIVNEFNSVKIEEALKNKVNEVVKKFPQYTDTELAKVISRYGHWEFEDYQPNT